MRCTPHKEVWRRVILRSLRWPYPTKLRDPSIKTFLTIVTAAALCACATSPMTVTVDNAAPPEAVCVPAGQKVVMATAGVGEITCECREKKGMAGRPARVDLRRSGRDALQRR